MNGPFNVLAGETVYQRESWLELQRPTAPSTLAPSPSAPSAQNGSPGRWGRTQARQALEGITQRNLFSKNDSRLITSTPNRRDLEIMGLAEVTHYR